MSNSKDAMLNSNSSEEIFVAILDRIDPATLAAGLNCHRSLTIHHSAHRRLQPLNIAPFTHVCMSCVNRSEAKLCHKARDAMETTFGDTYQRYLRCERGASRGSNSSVNPRSFTREGPRQRTVRVTQPLLRAPLGDSSRFSRKSRVTVAHHLAYAPVLRSSPSLLFFQFR